MDAQVLDLMKITVTGMFGAVITPLVAHVLIPAIKTRVVSSTVGGGQSGGNAHPEGAPPVIETPKGGTGGRRVSGKMAIILWGVIGVVVFGLVAYTLIKPTFLSACPLFAATSVAVTFPSESSTMPLLITTEGTDCHLPADKELWLLVVAEGVNGFFPQQGPILASSDGRWSASAILGQKGTVDIGREFVLYTALADQEGQAAIHGYFASAPDFKPLFPLPGGIQLINQVHVVRR